MSDFITLAKRVRQECGVSGADNTVVNATGEWSRIVNWTATAWLDIQMENPEWEWMRKSLSFNTVAHQSTYSPTTDIALTDFSSWKEDSFRVYLQSAGIGTEQLLPFRDYNSFRNYYLLSSNSTTYSRPSEITIKPNKDLILGLSPDDIYTVSGEYYKEPIILTLDADTPDMPTKFHMAIVYKAMMSYGSFEAANEVYSRGEKEYKSMLNKIRYDQMPSITRGSSLV